MNLPVFIARRYLFAKKSHNVINIISYITVAGVAIGTMALIIVLSAFNGIDRLVGSLFSSFDSDFKIAVVEGKFFSPVGEKFDRLKTLPGIVSYAEVLEENVFLEYQDKKDIAVMRGVDSVYEAYSKVRDYVFAGEFELTHGDLNQAVLGQGIASRLNVGIHFTDPLVIHVAKRGAKFSITRPQDAISTNIAYPAGWFAIEQELDDRYLFVPLRLARELTGLTNEVSFIELMTERQVDQDKLQAEIQTLLGDGFTVKNRYQQNETLYRMMKSEKVFVYFILVFMATIISFNVVASLTMLIIEKKADIGTFRSLGAGDKLIKRIFLYEGWFISLLGVAVGLVLGLSIAYLQQYAKPVKMPGTFVVDAFPVAVQLSDVLLVSLTVIIIGYLASALSVSFLAKRLR